MFLFDPLHVAAEKMCVASIASDPKQSNSTATKNV